MILIFIRILGHNIAKERFRSKFLYAVLVKWVFENFRGPFYDDVVYKDGSYLSTERVKIKL